MYKGLVDACSTNAVPAAFGISMNYYTKAKAAGQTEFHKHPYIFNKPLSSLAPKGSGVSIP